MAGSELAATPSGRLPGLEGLSRRPLERAVRGPSGAIYHGTATYFNFQPYHPVRKLAIHIVEASFFETLVALVIAANVVTLAWASPVEPTGTWKSEFIEVRTVEFFTRSPTKCRADRLCVC